MIATAGEDLITIWSIKSKLIRLCNFPIITSFTVTSLAFLGEKDSFLYALSE
jgi:hypothetical protein